MDAHREAMADKSYADVFDKAPTLWFFAQMLLPITPGDLGVSLSRPVRYTGSFLKDVTGGDHGPLGFLGDYAKASDPLTAAFAVANMGPIYTWNQLQKIQQEAGKIVDVGDFGAETVAATPATGLTMSDFTGNAGTPTP